MTSFCAYKYGHFQLSIWILELLSGIRPPEGMWAIFSSWAQKTGKRKVSKANALPKWDPALAALAVAIAAGMLRNSAWATELAVVGLMWLSATTAEPSRCDVGFCLYEGLNVSLYGATTLWFPRLAFQTPVCAHMCICTHEREIHTRAHVHTHICSHKYLYPHRPTL